MELSKAFTLAVPRDEVLTIRDEVAFFQAVKAALVKSTMVQGRAGEDLDYAIQQIVSKAVVSNQVIDIFAMARLPTQGRSCSAASSPSAARCLRQFYTVILLTSLGEEKGVSSIAGARFRLALLD